MDLVIKMMATLADWFIDENTFIRIKAAVERWDDKMDPDGVPFSGDEKLAGVKDEIQLIGIKAAQWTVNLLIELAVATLRVQAKK